MLIRLVELNVQRAAEEAKGHVRWLRPEYQAPEQRTGQQDTAIETEREKEVSSIATTGKQTWPKTMSEQVRVVRDLLTIGPQTAATLTDNFKRKPTKAVEQVLIALEVLGQAKQEAGMWQGP